MNHSAQLSCLWKYFPMCLCPFILLCSLVDALAKQYIPGIINRKPGKKGIISPNAPIPTKKIPKPRYITFMILLFEGITFILTFLKGLNTIYLHRFLKVLIFKQISFLDISCKFNRCICKKWGRKYIY